MTPVLIAIGSNINKEDNIALALNTLDGQAQITLVKHSRIYETVAIGSDGRPTEQPSFYNLAAWLKTDLDVLRLRDLLRAIEANLGRVRTSDKFAPRPIDLDIVYFGPDPITVDGLQYPDVELGKFPHLICPLAEVAPHWTLPVPLTSDSPSLLDSASSDTFTRDAPSGKDSQTSLTLEALSAQLLQTETAAAQILRIIE